MKHTIPITQHRIFSIPAMLVTMLLMIVIPSSLVQAMAPIAGFGTVLDFDGTDDNVDLSPHVANIEGFSQGTIEGWFKVPNTKPHHTIFNLGDNTANQNRVSIIIGQSTSTYTDESINFTIRRGGTVVLAMYVRNGTTTYMDNQWHHFAVVTGGGNNQYYIDGINQAVTFMVGNTTTNEFSNINTPNALHLGILNRNNIKEYFLEGQLDEIRIWNIARTQAEIQANMYTTLQGNESGLIGYWQFDENTGTTAFDKTANNNDGTLTNMDNSDWVNGIIGNPTFTTNENTSLNATLSAYDADGDALTYSIVTTPNKGNITNGPDNSGAFTYTPTATGTDTFTYKVNDASVDSNIATVTVTVTSLVVDNIGDTDDGDYSTGQNTLREAIVNASAGNTITFNPSIAGQTIIFSNQLTIDKDLTIDGSGQSITLSGDSDSDGDGDVSIFKISNGMNVTINDLIFTKSRAISTYSGVIENKGNLIINESMLSDSTGGNVNGAIYNDYGNLIVNNCTFANNNFSGFSGSILNLAGTVTVNDSIFSGNTTSSSGGSVIRGEYGTVTLNNITAFNNTGSTFVRKYTTINVNNSTIVNNNDEAFALSSTGTTTIKNTTISGNKKGIVNAGTLHLLNTIVANSSTTDCENTGTIATNTNNLIEDATCSLAVNGDPKLGSLQDNGGDTQTIALLPDSVAINAGDNATCSSIGNLDQRGITRPQTTTCDIGAYEKRAPAFSSTHQTSINVNAAYSYSITTIDNEPTDGASPIISAPTKPTWLTLTDNNNGTGTLTGTPTSSEVGTHNVTLRLNDSTENIDQTFTITVNKLDQTINFETLNDKMEGNSPFTINATATSGLSVGFSVSGNCTISGNSLTITGAGSCTITASQAGNAEYNAAPDVSQSFSIANLPTPTYKLTVNKTGSGTITGEDINCGSDCNQYFEEGTRITLTATSDTNFVFDGFSGDCDEKGTVLINEDKSCTAIFLRERTLTISTNGQGIVNDCGTECTQIHLDGKTVQLSVTPDDGVALSNWQGDCDEDGTVLMNSNKSCTANFTQGFTLEVTIIGKGTVTGENLNCSENCTVNFPNDTAVTLEAKPDVEWTLKDFTGDCDNTGNVQMTADKTCTVTFVEDPNIPNNGDGNADGIKDIEQSNVVSLPDLVAGDYLTLEVELTCSIDDVYADKPENQGNYDDAYEFPQGMMYFDLGCAETDVIIYFHAIQNAQNPILQKYGPTTPGDLNTLDWFVIPNVVFGTAMIGGKSVVTGTYHLVDGELGDHTGVDGHIIDPVGLSIK